MVTLLVKQEYYHLTNIQIDALSDNLLPDYWNLGYATEITKALVSYAFEDIGIERVEALAMSLNIASCKVLEKSGFTLEGILRHFTKIKDKYYDVCYYSIISSDFFIDFI